MTRHESKYVECVIWLDKHFSYYGDVSPTTGQIHLDYCEAKEIYEQYSYDMKITYPHQVFNSVAVDYTTFLKNWNSIFPHVSIRAYKQVSGKCKICFFITEGRKGSKTRTQLKAFQEAHQLHKMGMFMLERISYKKRRDEAMENNKEIASIIIDGMDQNHCRIPNLANQLSFPDGITQHLTGILEHVTGSAGSKNDLFYYKCIIL